MKCLVVFIGLLAICLAATESDKKDEIKSKRQIHQGRQSPQPRQYIIRAAGQSDQIQEFSPEYLNLLQELSAHQEQQQQESIQTNKKPQGHRFQQYQIPSQYSFPQHKQQPEAQTYQEAEYLAQLNRKPQIESKKPEQQSLKVTPSQGYNVQPTPAAVELQTHFSTADYENYQAALQQQLELEQQQQPINHQQNQYIPQQSKQVNHPLAESSLEKEIAKLIASNKAVEPFSGHKQQLQSYRAPAVKPKSQPKPEIYSQQKYQYLQPQTQQQQQVYSTFTSPKPHRHRYAYIAPALQNFEEPAQYQENPNKIQNTEYQYLQKEYAQQQHQNHQNHQNHQQQQQPQHKIQYSPIEEKPQPQPQVSYDRSTVMKVIEAPQLQYDKPQQQQFYHKSEESVQQQQQLYQKAIDSQSIDAPSHSSIYVSQSTGLPKHRPQQRKHEVKEQQNVQQEKAQEHQSHESHHHHNHRPHQQQPQIQEQQQKLPTVRLPPPNNGEPITQEEFQALVDAGYSVQAIPVHVPVPVEEYQKHIEQQSKRKHSFHFQPQQYQQQPQQLQQREEQSESYSRPTEYGRPVKGAGKNKH